ncbi:Fe-S cluster assembly protein SufD [Phormidium sp. CLA17]|uniref:Fe-S cluster assembly protein SufD n=1 Tax=Leptolyngbya sp. Cla-17 TaxID=2803751 RepID=UPI001490B29D|nr:Fe-S cluster assembly protein SufD [Leptolyngbya sp. Cla-17]MBM0742794.1 Fe-S cluster assembly protein SufD [Leptolyngbya sp. Cla-17]
MIELSTVSEIGNRGLSSKVDRAAYLQTLLHLRLPLPESLIGLQVIRDRATARIQELAIPSTRDEEWRFADLSSLLQVDFQTVSEPSSLSFPHIQPFILPEAINSRLVFVNGVYDPALSAVDGLPDGVLVTNLATAAEFRDCSTYLAQQPGAEEVFTALNTASFTDGALIWVEKDQVIDSPIQLLYVSTATQLAIAHPRCLVVAQSGSKLTLIEEFVTLHEGIYFTNAVTEVVVSDSAEVNHTRIQRDSVEAFHIGKTTATQAQNSRYTCNAVSLGGKLSRHNLEVYQTGEQTDTVLNGLTMITGDQVGDTHSAIAFTKPHSTSHQIHKCVVDDHAHAIFNGKVLVPKAAQLTNAGQLSKTLLLSPKARIDTKPQLEIVADNVKCAHGATVSQLDNDEVFYLQSRGIDEASARKLLVYAFAYEVIDQIPVASLKERLSAIARPQQP